MAAEAPQSVVEAEEAPESTVEAVAAQLALAAGIDAPNGVNGHDVADTAARPGGIAANGSSPAAAPADPVTGGSAPAETATDTGGGAVDPPHFAAAAVLDVLRATGWADAAEAAQLRAEVVRLRELLDMVVRDHRAREASAAGTENQQLYWLVPLLRAAHGVAFGTLGAKVHLRTAVQEVPPDVLASAGLGIPEHLPPERDADH